MDFKCSNNTSPTTNTPVSFTNFVLIKALTSTKTLISTLNVSDFLGIHREINQKVLINQYMLSPLIFAMVIELLAAAVHADPLINSITVCGTSHKVGLYTDDMIVSLPNLKQSLPTSSPTVTY